MNTYTFEDIYIGMTETFDIVVAEEMLESFGNITGDNNPLHTDETYALGKGFKGKVCYGMLTASFLSTLAGVYLPGERSIIREVSFKLPKPVYVGDQLTITGEVTEINTDFRFFDIRVTVRNGNGEKVLRGKMQMGVL